MRITADEQAKSFRLRTAGTEYQMKVDRNGVLKHVWYGRTTDCDMEYLLEYPDIGFSGEIYEEGQANNRRYSLDTLPLEYPGFGVGDYRIPALKIVHSDGTYAVDLRYRGFNVKSGKYAIPGLPAVYAVDADEAETLEIYLKDAASELAVTLRYGVLPKFDIITRSAVISNGGNTPVMLENAMSFCLDLPRGKWERIFFPGRWGQERIPARAPLFQGIQESSSRRGASSHQQNPAAILCSEGCSETSGECYGAALMYSGSFKTQIELDQIGQARFVMGLNPELFLWKLEPGEEFHTPEAILSYSWSGFERLTHNFHNVIRSNVVRGKFKDTRRPVLVNSWEAAYFNFDEARLLNIAKQAAELGVELFVMDDGWFGRRDDDNSGLGDWFVNENKLRGGLKPLVDSVRALGMEFGIWMEPEMVSEDSDLFRAHPEWAIRIPGRKPTLSRHQLVLDMSRADVREYLYGAISAVLKSADISYVKWDFNRHVCDWYSEKLSPDRMGELPHRFVLGLYELLERLTSDFPDVLFEGCSGGGGRFDAGMLYYTPQIWCSDDTDAYERTKIQYGTSFFYPISAVGSHVSTVPNHQTGRITPFETRAVAAMAGSFGYELDPGALTEDEKSAVREQIERFKRYDRLIHNGEYYRLSDPLRDRYAAWEYLSRDEILVHCVTFRAELNMPRCAVKLRGLDPDAVYRLDSDGKLYTGAALIHGGVLLPPAWGDYSPAELHFIRVNTGA